MTKIIIINKLGKQRGMWLSNLKTGLKKGFLNKDKAFIRRWPVDPKVIFYGPPNVFKEEIMQR